MTPQVLFKQKIGSEERLSPLGGYWTAWTLYNSGDLTSVMARTKISKMATHFVVARIGPTTPPPPPSRYCWKVSTCHTEGRKVKEGGEAAIFAMLAGVEPRETREGWPLLCVETEANGDSWITYEKGFFL
jgi:hypothetical protein